MWRHTFLLPPAKSSDSISSHFITPLDHLVQAPVPQNGVEPSLHDGKQVLGLALSRLFVEFDAPIEPADGPLHRLADSRAHRQT